MVDKEIVKQDIETDVVVVGYGGAGATAAITAHDNGVRVIILEKMPDAGGKFPNRTSGVEVGYAAEVVKATAGMTREQANEIAKQLLPKYEDKLHDPPVRAECSCNLREGSGITQPLAMFCFAPSYSHFDRGS